MYIKCVKYRRQNVFKTLIMNKNLYKVSLCYSTLMRFMTINLLDRTDFPESPRGL